MLICQTALAASSGAVMWEWFCLFMNLNRPGVSIGYVTRHSKSDLKKYPVGKGPAGMAEQGPPVLSIEANRANGNLVTYGVWMSGVWP